MILAFIRPAMGLLLFFLTASSAFAQRGATYETHAKPWESPTQGYPGYFDTHVARKGSLVAEFPPLLLGIVPTPFMALDYGVSDTLTIGTNAIFTTVPWLLGGFGASLKVRSLLIGNSDHQSAITFYGGLLRTETDPPVTAQYQNATWNDAWRFSGRHTLTGHLQYMRVSADIGKTTDIERASLGITTIMLGGGYGFEISHKSQLRLNGVFSAYSTVEADTVAMSINQSAKGLGGSTTSSSYVAQYEYHTDADWVIGVGLMGLSAFGAPTTNLPWLTFATRW